jgi:hypothetical protein
MAQRQDLAVEQIVDTAEQEAEQLIEIDQIAELEALEDALHILVAGLLDAGEALFAQHSKSDLDDAAVVGITHATDKIFIDQAVNYPGQGAGRLLGRLGELAHPAGASGADRKESHHLRHCKVDLGAREGLEELLMTLPGDLADNIVD